jgi:hypothetical protein
MAVATDATGNVFITGIAIRAFDGVHAANNDAFVAKYAPDGTLKWTRQLGSPFTDFALAVATDASGNVFITGNTEGSLDRPNTGEFDAFVSKFTPDGLLAWTRQLGTSSREESNGVATDAFGNVFITGITLGALGGHNAGGRDSFVSKYTNDGNLLFIRQLGTSEDDYSTGVTTDSSGDVFITGVTYGALGGPQAGNGDAFVVKLSVPEPSTLLLATFAAAGLGVSRRRR